MLCGGHKREFSTGTSMQAQGNLVRVPSDWARAQQRDTWAPHLGVSVLFLGLHYLVSFIRPAIFKQLMGDRSMCEVNGEKPNPPHKHGLPLISSYM